jgi:cytochrome c556
VSEETSLTLIAQARLDLDALANHAISLDELGQHLNQLWQQAEAVGDQAALVHLPAIWDQANQIAAAAQQATGLAATALNVAQEIADQRDTVLAQYTELHDAIDNIDADHPAVARLMDITEEMVYDHIHEWNEVSAEDKALEVAGLNALIELKRNLPGVDPIVRRRFVAWLLVCNKVRLDDGDQETLSNALTRIFISAGYDWRGMDQFIVRFSFFEEAFDESDDNEL